jgi:UDP-N-acetylglucosamine 2-epimerase (non-hydrolysing)
MRKIIIVAGARPNFIKIAPLMKELAHKRKQFNCILVHTGQHYDFKMSEIFFQNLKIPKPEVYLNIGSGSHAVQTAKIMTAFERILLQERPDIVIVVGDVNSTLACSLVAAKLNIKIAHVEAGLRSFDRMMPEEINRIVTDSLSDFLFVSEKSGLKNLKKEGIHTEKVFFVGNIMIDTLLANRKVINKSGIVSKLDLIKKKYCVMTLHRPSNVDSKESLSEIIDILEIIAQQAQIVYPVHPRTLKMIKLHGFLRKLQRMKKLLMVEPLGYVDFMKLVKDSIFVLTDSGGIQEETTVLNIPCLTMRENTERPVTVEEGTNYLVGREQKKIVKHVYNIINGKAKTGSIPELWDGKTAKRISSILSNT